MMLPLLLLTSISLATAVSALELSPSNFDELTAGKTVFIKFYAPYCGHCQKLAPVWKDFAANFTSPVSLIAEVDCSKNAENEKWCAKHFGILGFPTLLYGDPSHEGSFLTEYNGNKDFASLMSFANETLTKQVCSPGNLEGCDAKTRKQLERYWKMSFAALEKELASKQKAIDDAERKFKQQFDKMKAQYDKYSMDFELKAASIKQTLNILKEIKRRA